MTYEIIDWYGTEIEPENGTHIYAGNVVGKFRDTPDDDWVDLSMEQVVYYDGTISGWITCTINHFLGVDVCFGVGHKTIFYGHLVPTNPLHQVR